VGFPVYGCELFHCIHRRHCIVRRFTGSLGLSLLAALRGLFRGMEFLSSWGVDGQAGTPDFASLRWI